MAKYQLRVPTAFSLFVNAIIFCYLLFFVYSCLEALFTGEIGFGRSHSLININQRPGWFWFAFWFQLILGLGALPVIWQEISSLRNKFTTLDPKQDRDKVFPVEVTQISSHGVWLLTQNEELFMSFEDFPWLKSQSFQAICHVEESSPDHFYWPEIDVDLTAEMIKHPERFPLQAKQ